MKAFTDFEQSKRLAEILPLESADMLWGYYYNGKNHCIPNIRPFRDGRNEIPKCYTPAWSLAALLNVIQKTTPYKMEHFGDKKVQLTCVLGDKPWELIISDFDNEVDACVEMIMSLNEQNLL